MANSVQSALSKAVETFTPAEERQREVPDWIDGHLALTDNTESPFTFRLWTAISTIAAALQRKVSLNWGFDLYPNMYVVLVAPAGRARKGTAIRPMVNYLNRLGIPLAASSTTREALIKALSESHALETAPDGRAFEHSSLTVIAPELTVFLGYNNLAMIADLTDWFDCADDWSYRTKTQGIDVVKGVFLNILGATTPDLIRTALPADAVGGGLTSRIIFVYEQNKGKLVPFPFLSKEDKALQKQLQNDLHRIALLKGEFKYAEEFLEIYGQWYAQAAESPPFNTRVFDGYVERRPIHLLKLCMICSVSRSNELVLRKVDIERALSYLNMTEQNMPYTFAGLGTQKHAALIDRIMTDLALKGSISIADLLRQHWNEVSDFEMRNIIQTLVQMNYATYNASKRLLILKEPKKTE